MQDDARPPEALALEALAWILCDDDRAQRLLTLTGLTPEDLRAGLGERGVQAAILGFLADHEPDLIEAAVALGVTPETLAAAGAALDR